ncbi:hypothetical protein EMIHUDRAFT_193870 [Emiliania huxleyi CCMP1516]|uniref:Uncharacterized protein n=2 Tax=Emiliania huxleyi TaxID=2903 RepID=A0A0D3L0J6_EMIH1|nr:hypothetical protein EMIHUDRAFT_193870 [Emiliania huxleyi CCMP1516]EOD41531.1 hypothetical protein EMIHUDRAFT_193870 [Emiliania huxleyi CCMP1516]|eukprot:XP_005793960.1 hypothetical protein EMIHUDRAFT_193870 [Emiliania huxleyi CCMP1516]
MLDPEKGRVEKSDTSSPETPAAAKKEEKNKAADAAAFAFCFVGLQVSYLTWGFVQEKVMTKEYTTGKFPSATFCVFSNRVLAIVVAMAAMGIQHRSLKIPAPFYAFAPCSISNTLSSYGQYEARSPARPAPGWAAASVVFATLFYRVYRSQLMINAEK